MKLKQACYDPAFCRMGFRRFAPLGILYTLGLVLLTLANVVLGQSISGSAMFGIRSLFEYAALANLAYAFILVELLLGDLYVPRICYAIHALPVTRGGWFGTQVIQGILSVIPGILICGGLMAASVTRFRILIPIWMGVCFLQFLFFFGLALLCGVGAGNRMGMALLYGLANFFGVVLSWARLKLFASLIYGMYIPDTRVLLCPLSSMLSTQIFTWEMGNNVYMNLEDGPAAFYDSREVASIEIQPGGIWTMVIFAALGILAVFLAMKLLNRRKPECAGDLLAFRKTEPVILVLCTLSSGVAFHAASILFDWSMGYLMLALGLVMGYYGCLMLLKRQVNVFTGKALLPLAAMGGLMFLALAVTGLDLFGVTDRMPETDQIESVSLRVPYGYHDTFYASEAADIEKVRTIHQDALEEHRQREAARPVLERIFGNEEDYIVYMREDGTSEMTGQMFLIYTMKNGSQICRSYSFHESTPHLDILRDIFSQPEYVFSELDLDISSESDVWSLVDMTQLIQLTCWPKSPEYGFIQENVTPIAKEDWVDLVEALLADGEAGSLAQSGALHPGGECHDNINIYFPSQRWDGLNSVTIQLYQDATHTLTWLENHGYRKPNTQ